MDINGLKKNAQSLGVSMVYILSLLIAGGAPWVAVYFLGSFIWGITASYLATGLLVLSGFYLSLICVKKVLRLALQFGRMYSPYKDYGEGSVIHK